MNKYFAGLLLGGMVWLGVETGYNKLSPHDVIKTNAQYHRIGLLSDIHGDKEGVLYFLNRFKENEVDAVVVTGDIADRSQWMFTNTGEEIIQMLGQSGFAIYILPGNHDQRWFYEKVMEKQTKKYLNLHDLLQERRVDAGGIDFISNPYGTGKNYWLSGYYTTDYGELEQLIVSFPYNDPLVLITHQPPLCKGKHGIDYARGMKNEGNAELDRIMRKHNVTFSFSGHIHSASGGCDELGNYLPQKKFSTSARFNPGAVIKHMTKQGEEKSSGAIVTIKGREIMYELLARDYLKRE